MNGTVEVLQRLVSRVAVSAIATVSLSGTGFAADACDPPVARCDPADLRCSNAVSESGNMVEPKTGRPFFLDVACDLAPGDVAIFILNVHGTGAPPNWHRHYFPVVDVKDTYKLIVATPKAAGTQWRDAADLAYLQAVVEDVYARFPNLELKFWIAGHSQGGGYAGTLMCKGAFVAQPIGYVSLSGGRIGAPLGGAGGEPRNESGGRGAPSAGETPNPLPSCAYSHIYSAGDLESGQPLPEVSRLAEQLGCTARVRRPDIVDSRAGYVHDSTRQNPPTPSWGRLQRPGTTEWAEYTGCPEGRVVADFWRIDKGHTEGLEPNVTEAIIKVMAAASR